MSFSTVARILLSRTVVGAALGRVPLLERAYARRAATVRNNTGLQWGVFGSYAAAEAAIPRSRTAGWDHEDAATIWTDSVDSVRASTYPILFWLKTLLKDGTRLTDLGGSIGITFYGFRRYNPPPAGLSWTVVELPHLVEEGRRVAVREAAPELAFATDLAAAPPCDVLLAGGALQFMPRSVPGLLEMLPHRPPHILINKIPLISGPDCWTLHNFGPAITPYHLYNERAFLHYFADHGYTVRDRWDVMDISCDIPFHPRQTVPSLTGFYFVKA